MGQRFVSGQQKSAAVVNLAKADTAKLGATENFPNADPKALNFLITGADNNACVAPDSPFAGAFGDRSAAGQRSDTIMIMRVDPSTSQAAVLSFPRDLWVHIHGSDSDNRINSAYVKNNPTTLIRTIYDNFGIGIDHFVQVDFCAFQTLVNAVGGVTLPFAYPTRDLHTGLNVPAAGCFKLSGDHALAYVRSRHYEYLDPKTGKWTEDGYADLGRISRQQDFLRRLVAKALSTGVYTPSVARGLIHTAQQYVVTDRDLTLQKMLQFAGVVRGLDQNNLRSYQIEVKRETRSGSDVLIPKMTSSNMSAVLAVFRGRAPLLEAPKQVATKTAAATAASPTANAAANPAAATATTAAAPLGGDGAEENSKGIVPPRDVRC
jgi:LCP family protein required for cell wall assembly